MPSFFEKLKKGVGIEHLEEYSKDTKGEFGVFAKEEEEDPTKEPEITVEEVIPTKK